MNKPLILIINALALFIFTFAAEAKVYKWTDSNGNVVFSDVPPAQESVEALENASLPKLDNSGQATALALQARERIMNNPFAVYELMAAGQEIEAALLLDEKNAMVQVAISELALKHAYSHGDAFKSASYRASGLQTALEHAQNSVAYAPENVLCLAQLGKVLLIQGQKDAFVEVLRQMHSVASETYYT